MKVIRDYWYCFKCGEKKLRLLKEKTARGLFAASFILPFKIRYVKCDACKAEYYVYYSGSKP